MAPHNVAQNITQRTAYMLRSTTKSRKALVTGAKAAEMACGMQT